MYYYTSHGIKFMKANLQQKKKKKNEIYQSTCFRILGDLGGYVCVYAGNLFSFRICNKLNSES